MRDNAEGMIELIAAEKVDGHYFAVIAVERDGLVRKFRFGIYEPAYGALKRILQTRPFDLLPGLEHRYYLKSHGSPALSVRIELKDDGKEFRFDAPEGFVSNLEWFQGLRDLSEADYLSADDP